MTESMTETATTPLGVISSQKAERLGFPFLLILIYLFMEYVRPADPMKIPMVISVILFFSWVTLSRKHWSPQVILFVLLLPVIAVMGPVAKNSYSIFWGFQVMAVQLFCIAVPIIHFVSSLRKVSVYVNTVIAIFTYVAIYAMVHGGQGPGGIIGDENDVALAVTMVIPFAFASIFSARTRMHKVLYVGIVGLMVASVISTYSRGGFLGLIPVLFYCFLLLPKKRTGVAIGIVLVAGVLMFAPQSYWDEMATIERDAVDTEQGTGALRRDYWEIAWRMFLDNPIVGVGLDNFTWNIPEYQSEEQYGRMGRGFAGSAAHSIYFTLLAELGIAGAFIFTALVWYDVQDTGSTIKAIRGWKGMKTGLVGGGRTLAGDLGTAEYYAHAIRASLLGYLVSGVFLSVFTYPHFWLLTALTVALRLATEKRIRDAPESW